LTTTKTSTTVASGVRKPILFRRLPAIIYLDVPSHPTFILPVEGEKNHKRVAYGL
jgi:hypothetical protein